jgi:hypothetical protein
MTPIKSIREKCLDCSCQQPKEVRLCPVTTCALWPYRMGRRPTTSEREQCDRQEVLACEN